MRTSYIGLQQLACLVSCDVFDVAAEALRSTNDTDCINNGVSRYKTLMGMADGQTQGARRLLLESLSAQLQEEFAIKTSAFLNMLASASWSAQTDFNTMQQVGMLCRWLLTPAVGFVRPVDSFGKSACWMVD